MRGREGRKGGLGKGEGVPQRGTRPKAAHVLLPCAARCEGPGDDGRTGPDPAGVAGRKEGKTRAAAAAGGPRASPGRSCAGRLAALRCVRRRPAGRRRPAAGAPRPATGGEWGRAHPGRAHPVGPMRGRAPAESESRRPVAAARRLAARLGSGLGPVRVTVDSEDRDGPGVPGPRPGLARARWLARSRAIKTGVRAYGVAPRRLAADGGGGGLRVRGSVA
jgi:hypothetical protein